MEQCIFCRHHTYDRPTNYCTTCGKPKLFFSEVIAVYGKEWKNKCSARFAITDKFLIIKKESRAKKGMTASFGLVGAIVAATIEPAKGSPLGYYSLSEIKHIIWPYKNKKLKNMESMKIVNHDGSDLILKGELTCTMFSHIIPRFKECGVTVIDGEKTNHGDTFCQKPFVNEDTIGCRVSPAAAEIVCMMKENFVAPAIAVPAAESVSIPVSVPATTPVPVSEPASVITPVPEPIEEKTAGTKEFKFCHECGNKLLRADKFCPECGMRQR